MHIQEISTYIKLDFSLNYSVLGKSRIRIHKKIDNPFYEDLSNKNKKNCPMILNINKKEENIK